MVRVKGYGVEVESPLEKVLAKELQRVEKQRLFEKYWCRRKCKPNDSVCRALKRWGCSVIKR